MTVVERRREGSGAESMRAVMGADKKGKCFIVLMNLEFSRKKKKNQQYHYNFQGINFFLETEKLSHTTMHFQWLHTWKRIVRMSKTKSLMWKEVSGERTSKDSKEGLKGKPKKEALRQNPIIQCSFCKLSLLELLHFR